MEGKEQWPRIPGTWIQSPAEPELSVCPQTYHFRSRSIGLYRWSRDGITSTHCTIISGGGTQVTLKHKEKEQCPASPAHLVAQGTWPQGQGPASAKAAGLHKTHSSFEGINFINLPQTLEAKIIVAYLQVLPVVQAGLGLALLQTHTMQTGPLSTFAHKEHLSLYTCDQTLRTQGRRAPDQQKEGQTDTDGLRMLRRLAGLPQYFFRL